MGDLTCPECGAVWRDGKTCEDKFHECGYLELSEPLAYSVHQLMVPAYMVQHNGYSDAGLAGIKSILEGFLEQGVTTQQMRKQMKDKVDSGKRDHKITGRPSQPFPPTWPMTIMDIDLSSAENYCTTITRWARVVLDGLQERQGKS